MKKKFLALVLALAVAVGGTACGGKTNDGDAATNTNTEGTVIVAMGSGFSTLDPGYVYEKYPQTIVNACYETLFKLHGDGTEPPAMVSRKLCIL